MRLSHSPVGKITLICSVAGYILLSTSIAVRSADLHGSGISLDEAVRRCDVIEVATIKFAGVGTTAGGTRAYPNIELSVSDLLKDAGNGPVQTCGLGVRVDEADPRSEEQYICFINNHSMNLMKVVLATEADMRAVKELISREERRERNP
jgi:hypothetical protein